MNARTLLETTIIQRGMRILRIKSPLPTIEPRLCVVMSEKNCQSTMPNKR